MIVNKNIGETAEIIGEIEQSTEFGITSDSKVVIIDSLINLYSKPIDSVVREITSNCIDAHRERDLKLSGQKPLDPDDDISFFSDTNLVEVNLKSDLISFKDFGVGLSEQRVKDIFTVFGGSTKRGNNFEIGGFGLGSKSPFAYTGTFYIKTARNGTLSTYLMSRGESVPTMDLVSKTPIKEKNYTEVVVPLKYNDFYNFRSAIYNQLTYFPQVYYKGIDAPQKNVIYEDEDCIIDLKNKSMDILVGNVQYPLESKYFTFGNQAVGSFLYNKCLKLKFKIGELTLVPSREAIRYTEETKKKIQDKLDKLYTEFKQIYDDVFVKLEKETDEDYLLRLFKDFLSSESFDVNSIKDIKQFITFRLFYFPDLELALQIDDLTFKVNTGELFPSLKNSFEGITAIEFLDSYTHYYNKEVDDEDVLVVKNPYKDNFLKFVVNYYLKKFNLKEYIPPAKVKVKKAAAVKGTKIFKTLIYENKHSYKSDNILKTSCDIDYDTLKADYDFAKGNIVVGNRNDDEKNITKLLSVITILNPYLQLYSVADRNYKVLEQDFKDYTIDNYLKNYPKINELKELALLLKKHLFIDNVLKGTPLGLTLHTDLFDRIKESLIESEVTSKLHNLIVPKEFTSLKLIEKELDNIIAKIKTLAKTFNISYYHSNSQTKTALDNILKTGYIDEKELDAAVNAEYKYLIDYTNAILTLVNHDPIILLIVTYPIDYNQYSYKLKITEKLITQNLNSYLTKGITSYEKLFNI